MVNALMQIRDAEDSFWNFRCDAIFDIYALLHTIYAHLYRYVLFITKTSSEEPSSLLLESVKDFPAHARRPLDLRRSRCSHKRHGLLAN